MQVLPFTLDAVRDYYGRVLQSSHDLKTSACCSTKSMPLHIRTILGEINEEVMDRFYGCGSPLPLALDGATVLDLGCGSGRDVFVASKLVGPAGNVIGVDMTAEQLDVARRNVESQMKRFGYSEPNVDFRHGYIEDLHTADLEDDSVDVVISNCVLNLSPDKPAAFREIFRVLKPGGELYFSDIFADRRIPAHLSQDPILHGECLAGALYIEDFRRLLRDLNCLDYRVVAQSPIDLIDPDIEQRIGHIGFSSMTIRAFKLPDSVEDLCEDYGQVAYYLGTIPEAPHTFTLDDHHVFETNRPMLVCGNTAAMISETRYGEHFRVIGDRSTHFGLFGCTTTDEHTENACASGSCC